MWPFCDRTAALLAIAIASPMPPMAGIVGDMFVSQVSGSYLVINGVVINGPAAGLITVITGSVARLDHHHGQAVLSSGLEAKLRHQKLSIP